MSKTPKRYKYSRKHKFYVYALLDPRKPGPFYYGHWKFSHEPFYVGKGHGNRFETTHKNDGHNIFKSRKIHNIRALGMEPIVVFKKSALTERQALSLEVHLIDRVGRANLKKGPLTNLTDGGEGTIGKIVTRKTRLRQSKSIKKAMTKEVRARISLAMRGNTNSAGRSTSEETRRKLSEWQKGVPKSPEHMEKLHAACRGRPFTEEHKAKLREAAKYKPPITETTRQKLSKWQKGKPKSLEHRKAMSEAAKKKPPMSTETKKKCLLVTIMRHIRYGHNVSDANIRLAQKAGLL